MSYDFIDGKLGMLEKRVYDLAKRRSHAEHETQIALADLIFAFLEMREPPMTPWKMWKTLKWGWRVSKARDQHMLCCPAVNDDE